MSLSWFSCGSSILVELEFRDVSFCGRRKNEKHREKPSKQGESQQQTQLAYSTRQKLNMAHTEQGGRGSECSLSAFWHPSSAMTLTILDVVINTVFTQSYAFFLCRLICSQRVLAVMKSSTI